jgi:hypothetical protein
VADLDNSCLFSFGVRFLLSLLGQDLFQALVPSASRPSNFLGFRAASFSLSLCRSDSLLSRADFSVRLLIFWFCMIFSWAGLLLPLTRCSATASQVSIPCEPLVPPEAGSHFRSSRWIFLCGKFIGTRSHSSTRAPVLSPKNWIFSSGSSCSCSEPSYGLEICRLILSAAVALARDFIACISIRALPGVCLSRCCAGGVLHL